MALAEFQPMFNKWTEFLQNLTTEWLIENYQRTQNRSGLTYKDPVGVDTYISIFKVKCGNTRFCFNAPSGLLELSFYMDEKLIDYLPMDVWKDFLMVLEL